MFRISVKCLAVAAAALFCQETFAIDWAFTGSNRDILQINSDKPGQETFVVVQNAGEIRIEHSYPGASRPDTISLSANLIQLIRFQGDEDRDVFENWTQKPLHAFGGAGNDELWGGDETNDVLVGEAGEDYCFGRGGQDVVQPGRDLTEGTADGGVGTDSTTIVTFQVRTFPIFLNITQGFRMPVRSVETINRLNVPITLSEYFSLMSK